MKTVLTTSFAVLALFLLGCGSEDSESANGVSTQTSDGSAEQVRVVVRRFQAAAARHDDAAACALMTDGLISGIVLHGVPPEHPQADCNVDAALFYPQSRATFPTAHLVYVRIDPHDSAADVQFDNGTRLKLIRSDGGEPWRIDDIGFRADRS